MNIDEEFKDQAKNSILRNLNSLKTEPKYDSIKKCYCENFDQIKELISGSDSKIAIEDINSLCGLTYNKMDSLLMQQINNGIMKRIISKNDLK